MKVRIEKLEHGPNAETDEIPNGEHDSDGAKIGEYARTCLYVGYTVEGVIAQPLTVGASIVLVRTKRNGVDAVGIFTTSPIKSFVTEDPEEVLAYTQNSVYRITKLFDEPERPKG